MNLKKRIPEPVEITKETKFTKKYELLDAKNYKNKNSSYRLVAKEIIKKFKIKEEKILDVACGYGGLIGILNEHLPKIEYMGLDASKFILSLARDLHKRNKNTKFIKGFSEKLPFKNESFDFVICRDSIHHFRDPLKSFKEMYRVTKKGGIIYVLDLGRDIPEKLIYDGFWKFFNWNPYVAVNYLYSIRASYTTKEIKQVLKKTSIKDYNIKNFSIKKPYNYFSQRWNLVIKK